MHSYIDFDIVHRFSDTMSIKSIKQNLMQSGISNVCNNDPDVYEEIAILLYNDFKCKLCNYKAYLETGMNMRMLMELRKTALLSTSNKSFFDAHHMFDTPQQVIDWRIKFLAPMFMDYNDDDWQYYWVMHMTSTKEQQACIIFDFDMLGYLEDTPDGYVGQDYAVEFMRRWTHYNFDGTPKVTPDDFWANYNRYYPYHREMLELQNAVFEQRRKCGNI